MLETEAGKLFLPQGPLRSSFAAFDARSKHSVWHRLSGNATGLQIQPSAFELLTA